MEQLKPFVLAMTCDPSMDLLFLTFYNNKLPQDEALRICASFEEQAKVWLIEECCHVAKIVEAFRKGRELRRAEGREEGSGTGDDDLYSDIPDAVKAMLTRGSGESEHKSAGRDPIEHVVKNEVQ